MYGIWVLWPLVYDGSASPLIDLIWVFLFSFNFGMFWSSAASGEFLPEMAFPCLSSSFGFRPDFADFKWAFAGFMGSADFGPLRRLFFGVSFWRTDELASGMMPVYAQPTVGSHFISKFKFQFGPNLVVAFFSQQNA